VTVQFFKGLRSDKTGGVTTEFAITVVPLLMLVLGMLQAGILFWRWQALESTALDAARCAGLNATSCQNAATTPANTQNYAVTTSLMRGLTGLAASNVTVTTGSAAQAACGSTTASVVSVALSYDLGTTYMLSLPSTLTATACFPLISS
jgi:Flp pilus assembly protein TadG